ncbi:MAG TPA: FHA domain-containing protein, partial [Leifsonia sp.]
GSTNGSQLNGQPVKKAIIEPESVITVGRTTIVFRVVPQASAAPASRDDATRRHDLGSFWGES